MTEKIRPSRIALDAWGDLEGDGRWTIAPQGSLVGATYDWRVRADKPLLRYRSFLFSPVFAANHRWAMARGEESLKLELARRCARTQQQRDAIPPPPGPGFRGRRGDPVRVDPGGHA